MKDSHNVSQCWNVLVLYAVVAVAVCPITGCGRRDAESVAANRNSDGVATTAVQSQETSVESGREPSASETQTGATVSVAREVMDFEPDRQTYADVIQPFLKTHCLRCHGPQKQEADFRVDEQLPNDFLYRTVSERWSEVLNMLNSGDMPPEGEPQPAAEETQRIAEWIETERLRGEEARKDRTIVLRRLNREEYNNTIRDLMGVKMDLVEEFPEDPPAGGFDNNGGALTISPLHLELYLKTAQKVLDRAIVDVAKGPGTIKWRFEVENGTPGGGAQIRLDNDLNSNVRLATVDRQPQDGMTVLRNWSEGVMVQYFTLPQAGEYTIRVRAAGKVPLEDVVRAEGPRVDIRHRRGDWERNGLDNAEKQKRQENYDRWSAVAIKNHYATDRSYRYGPPRMRILGYLGSRRPVLDAYDVTAPVEAPRVYESSVLMPGEKSSLHFSNPYRIPYAPHWNPHYIIQRDDFPRPELFVDWIEIEGPIYDAWPPSSHTRILIDSPHKGGDESAYARDVLANFMRRAFRRPLKEGEVEPKVALFEQVRPNKPSFEEAIKVPLLTVLASPHFLYLVEEAPVVRRSPDSVVRGSPDPAQSVDRRSPSNAATRAEEGDLRSARLAGSGDPRQTLRVLNDYELASRLSYFLWSSMPDAELFDLSKAGTLKKPATLRAQVDRMLADAKSAAFVKNFTGQWLELRKVGTNPPDVPRYDEHLEASMRGETEAFFEHVLRNDRSVLDFLSADYMTINERLARFYDIPGVKGDQFPAVPVPEGIHRGGLLSQASILAITSNGTRTSPVWRGVWVLNNLLGDPPPPPPPNAGDIPPVEQGQQQVTLRQRLQMHREQPQCARCHNKIDPLGFALENFDHSGEWREKDGTRGNSPAIDASAELPDGTEFVGVDGLRNALVDRQDQFLECLAEKMMTYAMGREMGYADESAIEDAVESMKANGLTLRSLLHHIVTSDTFRSQ